MTMPPPPYFATDLDRARLRRAFGRNGLRDDDARLSYAARQLGRPVDELAELTHVEAAWLLDGLEARSDGAV
jgi:hypothetical protein